MLPGTAQEFLPTLIVFGDQNKVLTLPEVGVIDAPAADEPAATEPAGDVTEPVADATEPAGDDAATEPAAEGGCGGAVSFAGLALVAALGTCTVFVAKKKED